MDKTLILKLISLALSVCLLLFNLKSWIVIFAFLFLLWNLWDIYDYCSMQQTLKKRINSTRQIKKLQGIIQEIKK